MSNLNKIILIGRLTADPAARSTPQGTALTTFTLAVDRAMRPDGTRGETDFIDISTFGRVAEVAAKYTNKGKQVLVEGRIQVRTFNDAGGVKKWATEVVASNVVFLGGVAKADTKEMPPQIALEPESLEAPAEAELSAEPVPAQEDIPF